MLHQKNLNSINKEQIKLKHNKMLGLIAIAVIMGIFPYTLPQYVNSMNLNQTDTKINNSHYEMELNETSPILSSEVRVLGTNDDDIIILDNVIFPLPTTVEAKEGNDVIRGSIERDLMYGGGGNDSIQGDSSNTQSDDVINGEDGNDELLGMGGSDSINGGNGDDNLYGGVSNDVLSGGPGEDQLYGDNGDDILKGGPDKDFFNCGEGVDIVQDFQRGIDEQPDDQCETIKIAN